MWRSVAVLFSLLLVSGCAGGPPPEIGPALGPVTTIDPEPQIRQKMDLILKDSGSAQYRRVGGPVPGRVQAPLITGGRTSEGWGFCYLINAKNSYGGYTGYQPYYFIFRDNALLDYAANPQLSSWNCFS
jgi:hypothetical protein